MDVPVVDDRGAPGLAAALPEVHEVRLGSGALADLSLGEARVRERFGVTVVSVERPDGAAVVNPSAETRLRPGDRLRVFGLPEQIARSARRRIARLESRGQRRKPFQIASANESTVKATAPSAASRSTPRSGRRSRWPRTLAAR